MNLVDMRTSPPRHMWKTWDRRTLPLTHVVVHHSATSPDTSIYEIAFYHVNNKDMPAIQYHYVITPSGKVCWMNDHTDMVWHAQSANEYALGVCLIGDFTDAPPSAVQIAALQELLHHINGVEGAKLQVIGHRDVFDGNTECPGNTWEQWRSQAVAEPKLIETIADPLEQYRKILWWQEEQRRAREKAAELHRQSIQAHVETSDLIERNRKMAEELLNYADKIAAALTDKEGAGYHLLDLLAEAKRNG